MNLDELELLHKAATPGEWLLSDVDIPPIVYLGAQKNEAMIACVDAGAGYANLPVNEAEANAKSIAALHNAFPALLALARDGERYRYVLTKLCMVQSASYGCKFDFVNLPAHFGDCEPDPIPPFNAAIDAARKGERNGNS